MKKRVDLSSSCAIVTGATGGIGTQFALELARRNCDLILTDLDEHALYETAGFIRRSLEEPDNISLYVLPLDLTAEDATMQIEQFCDESDLDPDILINNAGIFCFAPITRTSPRKLDTFIDLHIRSVTMLSRWFARRRKAAHCGWLLNMSSMSCWMPMPGLAMYASTKAYIRVFSRSLHYEMKDYGVGVTVACPGGIATDLFGLSPKLKELAVKIHVLDTPESFARKAVNRMLKKKKQYINGWLNRISILFVGITPTPVRMLVKHRLLDKGIVR